MQTCKARRVNDEMQCGTCGLVWDVNDPDRPACKIPTKQNCPSRLKALRLVKEIKNVGSK